MSVCFSFLLLLPVSRVWRAALARVQVFHTACASSVSAAGSVHYLDVPHTTHTCTRPPLFLFHFSWMTLPFFFFVCLPVYKYQHWYFRVTLSCGFLVSMFILVLPVARQRTYTHCAADTNTHIGGFPSFTEVTKQR
jgi:hypothetical protein